MASRSLLWKTTAAADDYRSINLLSDFDLEFDCDSSE